MTYLEMEKDIQSHQRQAEPIFWGGYVWSGFKPVVRLTEIREWNDADRAALEWEKRRREQEGDTNR